jgi:uncharacterized protein with PIN domain
MKLTPVLKEKIDNYFENITAEDFLEKTKDMRTTTAMTFIEINCECPNCNSYIDILGEDMVRESLPYSEFNVSNCDVEITCKDCGVPFIVTDIFY